MTFKGNKPAGWHVLIGDNGAGKSSIVRSVAAALIGEKELTAIRPVWSEWLTNGELEGFISIDLTTVEPGWPSEMPDFATDQPDYFSIGLHKTDSHGTIIDYILQPPFLSDKFSVAYGPFRRFSGGNPEWERVFSAYPRAGAHLSVFGEDVALTEVVKWIKDLDYARLREKEATIKPSPGSAYIFDNIIKFINTSGLLPHNTRFSGIGEYGPVFKDGNGVEITVTELSDGFRSILSLTFELIRQLIRVYDADRVFRNFENDNFIIDLPGVVLIDEIDAHLHPTWQTRIGQWFTQYFPKLQFIVTTHSPLICRACENGSIWRLAAPGSNQESGEVTGTDKEKLIYGNILDAYGTEVFGDTAVRSAKSEDKLERLGRLNMLSALGKISEKEERERQKLQNVLSTDAPTGLK